MHQILVSISEGLIPDKGERCPSQVYSIHVLFSLTKFDRPFYLTKGLNKSTNQCHLSTLLPEFGVSKRGMQQ